MILKRSYFLIIVLFIVSFQNGFSQLADSNYIKIGPEELQRFKGGHYYNFADKNKVNIEIILLGNLAGKYLIPEGTKLFDFLIMSGASSSNMLEDVKIVRFKSDSPKLQASEVLEYNLDGLYGDKQDILRPVSNPILKPGDMVIVPEVNDGRSLFYYIQTTITFVSTLVTFYYLIDNLIYRQQYRN